MKAFIIGSFLAMFLAFYVFTGGSNFEPLEQSPFVEKRLPEPEPKPEPKVEVAAATAEPTVTPGAEPSTDRLDDGGTLSLAEAAEAATDTRVAVQLTPATQPAADATTDLARTDQAQGTDGTEGQLVFSSLADSNDAFLTQPGTQGAATQTGTQTTAEVAEATTQTTPVDYRFVDANRVNVRGGPGTNFEVLTQVVRNDEVQVLLRDASGWVRLKTPTGEVGWMAERFLTASN